MVLASDNHVGAACNLHRGCLPYACPPELAEVGTEDERFAVAIGMAKSAGLASSGNVVILAHGSASGTSSLTNFRMVKLA